MKCLPKMIKQAGYLTGFYGKWHMQISEATARLALVACRAYLTANMTADLTRRLAAIHKLDVMHGDESEVSAAILGQPCLSQIVKRQGGFDYAAEILADNDAVAAGGHRPECMADRAMGFVRKARSAKQPLFLWFAPTLPQAMPGPGAGAGGRNGEMGGKAPGDSSAPPWSARRCKSSSGQVVCSS